MFQGIILTDPRNRAVEIPCPLSTGDALEARTEKECLKYARIIESPSSMIEMPDGRLYYFGLVDAGQTVVLEVVFREGWIAKGCSRDPSSSFIQPLLREGRFIPGSALN
jgi:hypothetical protein